MPHDGSDLDILISGGTLLTMSEDMAVIENPVIGIRDDKILFVETAESRKTAQPCQAREIIDASGCIILPGLINTHTHAAMVLFRGMADDVPLMTWLHDHIFPLEQKFVSREMVYTGAMLAISEMIRSGTTTFCDGYFYAGQVAEAAMATGIRTVCCLGFFDLDASGNSSEKLLRHRQTADKFIKKVMGVSPLVQPALFPHSPYMCAPDSLKEIKRAANEMQISFITHLAETQDEVKTMQDRYGSTAIRHLESLGILDERTVAVHCNWPDKEEIKILAGFGVKVSHNPESGMKLASGLAPVPEMLNQGITVGLGTDGSASNNDHDLFGEMGTTARVHKLATMDPTVLDAKTVLKMATIDGARVLGLDRDIGSIEAGKLADIILVNADTPRLTPLYNPYSQLVYAASGDCVATTIVHGKILMQNGKMTTINLPDVLEKANTVARSIREDGKGRVPRQT